MAAETDMNFQERLSDICRRMQDEKLALLIALHRPDVVRPDDLALRHAVQARYGLDHLPDPAEVADLAQRWRPYRSLASSLLLAAARPT